MKTLIAISILIIFSASVYAQKPIVSLSPIVEIPTTQDLIKTKDGYLSFKLHGGQKQKIFRIYESASLTKLLFDVTLIKYDESLKIIKENDLSSSSTRFGVFEPTIEQINGKDYLVYYEVLENDKDIMLKAVEIDPVSLSVVNHKELFKVQLPGKLGVDKLYEIRERRKLRIETSPDKSKTLFLFENGIDNSFTYSVVDKDLNVLFTKENMVDFSGDIVIKATCVDNSANVYTAYKTESKKEDKKGHILIGTASKKEKDILISDENDMFQILLLPSKHNYIDIIGTCFGNTDYISGVFSAKLSTTDFKLTNFKRTDFEEKFIELFDQNGLAYTKKNKFGLYPSKMTPYQLEDGSIGMIGEIRKVVVTSESHQNISGSYNSSSTKTVGSGSVLNALFINGKVVFSRVPKNRLYAQRIGVSSIGILPSNTSAHDLRFSSASAGGDIYALPYKNDLLVFYSDAEENLKLGLSEMPSKSNNTRNLVLVVATISNDGNVRRDMIVNLKDESFIALPVGIRYISNQSLQIPIRRVTSFGVIKDEFRWGNIEIK